MASKILTEKIGEAMLAISELSVKAQTLETGRDDLQRAFNGTIDNYHELRRKCDRFERDYQGAEDANTKLNEEIDQANEDILAANVTIGGLRKRVQELDDAFKIAEDTSEKRAASLRNYHEVNRVIRAEREQLRLCHKKADDRVVALVKLLNDNNIPVPPGPE